MLVVSKKTISGILRINRLQSKNYIEIAIYITHNLLKWKCGKLTECVTIYIFFLITADE